ncbi:hypothetical protein EVB81_121 [Rhizobium phage RHph_I46]|uniref:Uncharacterized protein n=1 Tax=Rhizobium phage RHph_I1_9 TaxID=2509729 RepID=A0A7S5R9G2_9CAUD|nr:hypothetical protein PP936_gp120 [Rhizobium phage RHph_I1_9]QIG69690.1 hypothetical protein EVB81_121 [Rhizobium phage RHph_I46]QIG70971.1 hypothetical protein EVB92_121 [Rhizobium phage RHph_I9]QIG73557.1 hypothetical protein EVC04_120 [Rhizobium phage RHph_I1_9]QIG76310.1 hypothetical protein EVC25_121 [Rhizobium phage RHph_I34]
MIILSTKTFEILLAKSEEHFPGLLRYIVMEIEDGVRTIREIHEHDNLRLLASMIFDTVRDEEYTVEGKWNFGRATTPVTKIQKILEQFMEQA